MAWAGPALVRFDPESGKPVPFPKGRETCRYGESYNAAGWKPRILGQETNCAEIPTIGGGRTFQDGFCVAPNGDIYVIATEAHGNIYDDLRKLGQAEKLKKQDRLGGLNFLVVYAPDGSMKHLSALPGLLHSNGIHVGRNGNVYVSMAVKPSGQKEPDGIAAGQPSHGYWGSLLCFGSSFDKFPLAAVNSSFEGKLEGKPDFFITNGTSVRTDGLRWHYGGVMPSTSASGECVCANSRFGFDGFERSFVPAMQTYNVNVLDANGNLIARLGGYANADSRGKDSPVVDPKTGLLRPRRADDPADSKPPKELAESVGFRWAPFITVTDEAVYALDYAIRRVERCTLSYAAEETVPAP
jgi:hypothetical protein